MSDQETFSITEIKRLCAKSKYLDGSDIHEGEKSVSFDGEIVFFSNKKPKKTGNEFKIPVQVKRKKIQRASR